MNFPLKFKFHLSPIALHGQAQLDIPEGWDAQTPHHSPSSAGSQARAQGFPLDCISCSIPCHQGQGYWGTEPGTRQQDKGQQTRLAAREVSSARTFSHWNSWPHKTVQSPSLEVLWCNLGLPTWITSQFYSFTFSFFPMLWFSWASTFIHIFRHFYIMEKRGEIGTKQFLKVLA